jgi:acyl-CoA synthetase (AMP-forming)/AMP-acid ligase II
MKYFEQLDYQEILTNGIVIHSSGTTNQPKSYFQAPAKIKTANEVARLRQNITETSKIYTCCKLTHAGGLLAQTLPALEIGAEVDVENFNAYAFVNKITNYTHTHITPLHAKAIMMTKGFHTLDLTGVWVTCGADPVTWNIIESFVNKGAKFLANWGMSEVGPIAINTLFDSIEKVMYYKSLCPTNATILGDVASCDIKLVNNELFVNGNISIYDDWYATKDKVVIIQDVLFYQGRTNKEIDLWNPIKS